MVEVQQRLSTMDKDEYSDQLSPQPDEKVLQIRDKLSRWLAKEEKDGDKLLRWLLGYELPSVSSSQESYIWIMRGLRAMDGSPEKLKTMAQRLARFLEKEPDMTLNVPQANEVLYNLLMLCSRLGAELSPADLKYEVRSLLASPLIEMYNRNRELEQKYKRADSSSGNRERSKLIGKWRGIDLRRALQSALIFNQVDDRLVEPVWMTMLNERKHDFLPGDEYNGYEGMYNIGLRNGFPEIDRVIFALEKMWKILESKDKGCREFPKLVRWVKSAYPQYEALDKDLIHKAHEKKWPASAMVRLDNLAIIDEQEVDTNMREAYIWELYLAYLKNIDEGEVDVLFYLGDRGVVEDGVVVKVRMDSNAASMLRAIAPQIEGHRLKCPDTSYNNVFMAGNECLRHLEENLGVRLPEDDPGIYALREGRVHNMKEAKEGLKSAFATMS